MPYQTIVVKPDAIRIGSAKIEIGDDVNALSNLGAVRNVALQEQWETVTISGDNVGTIKKYIRNHIATLTFNWLELDLDSLSKIRGGIDEVSLVDAESVSVTDEILDWEPGKPIKLANKNGNGTAVSFLIIKKVEGGTESTLEVTDYFVYVGDGSNGEAGATYVVPITTVQDGVVKANYSYTPNAARILTTGGKIEIVPKVVRLTNVNEDGKKFRVTIYKATNSSGINLTLPADDADDVWNTPVTLEGSCDANRAVGQQLFEIYDEQSVA